MSSRLKQRGLYMPHASLEFLLHAAVALGADMCLVPMSSSLDVTQPLHCPLSAEATDAVDANVLFDTFLPPECGRYRFGSGDNLDPSADTAASARRRLYLLLQHSDGWCDSVAGDVRGCSSSSDETSLRWVEDDLPEIEARWSYAIFLGLMGAVLPPLPPASRGDSQYLSLPAIASFVLRQLSLSTMRTQVWLPCCASEEGWRQWNRFRVCLGRDVLVVSAADGAGATDVKFTGPMCAPSMVRPVLQPAPAAAISRDNRERWCLAWLGEDVAALLPSTDAAGWPVKRAPDSDGDGQPTLSLWGSIGPLFQSLSEVRAEALAGHTSCGRSSQAQGAILFEGLVRRGAIVFGCAMDDESQIARSLSVTTSDVGRAWSILHNACLPKHTNDAASCPVDVAALDAVTAAYGDTLQIPLQPLGHHLDSSVYATFERDAPKYRQYAKALCHYFHDWKSTAHRHGASHAAANLPEVVVMVLGAGRGPLVTEVLTAATDADVRVHVVAVEKNPAAATFLKMKYRCDPTWRALENVAGHRVTIVPCDGRSLESAVCQAAPNRTPEEDRTLLDVVSLVSCVVSELLGSAGDNELSPECVDATLAALMRIRQRARDLAMHDDAPPDDDDVIVSIPESYRFLLAPLQSSALVDHLVDATRRGVQLPSHSVACGDGLGCVGQRPGGAMLPSLAVLHNVLVSHVVRGVLLDTPQVAWTFQHAPPHHTDHRRHLPTEHARSASLAFDLSSDAVGCCRVDLLIGFFDAVLYTRRVSPSDGDPDRVVALSTVPATWTPNMFSWFPCLLPLTSAVHFTGGGGPQDSTPRASLRVEVRRVCSGQHVHMEWAASKALLSPTESNPSATARAGTAWSNSAGWAACTLCTPQAAHR